MSTTTQPRFLQSYTRSSKVKPILFDDEDENLLIDFDTSSYVRLMKLFTPPSITLTADLKDLYFAHKDGDVNFLTELNKPFHIRCYLPKLIITRDEKIASKVVIMLNGLNEVFDYDLYDQLGESFAKQGITSILLPTPLHLNRKVQRRNPKDASKLLMPTDYFAAHPMLLYLNYLKAYNELTHLIELLNIEFENIKSVGVQAVFDKEFYKTYFSNGVVGNESNENLNAEKALVGFSMGGLKSLGFFCNFTPDLGCCISINSAPGLSKIDTTPIKVSRHTWQKKIVKEARLYVSALTKPLSWEIELLNLKQAAPETAKRKLEDFREIHSTLYYGANPKIFKSKLLSKLDKYLSIVGGADQLVKRINWLAKDILPEKDIHQISVAGVDHHPTHDPNWQDILPRIEQNILDFINSCNNRHFNRKMVTDVLRFLIEDLDIFNKELTTEFKIEKDGSYKNAFTNKHLERIYNEVGEFWSKEEVDFPSKDYVSTNELCFLKGKKTKLSTFLKSRIYPKPGYDSSEEAKELFLQFYYLSKGYYPNFPEVIEKIAKDIKNDDAKRQEVEKENLKKRNREKAVRKKANITTKSNTNKTANEKRVITKKQTPKSKKVATKKLIR